MFTVCPKCALTLVVTAEDLRVAQGYVRCGRCSSVFNALARLTEERLPEVPAAPPPSTARDTASPAAPLRPRHEQPERPALAPSALHDEAIPEDDVIPEDALEFDPSKTDVSSVFVEPPPNPQWTAATGTFKAMLAANQEAAHAEAAPATAPATPAQDAPPPEDEDGDIDVELDPELLASILHADTIPPAPPPAAASPPPPARKSPSPAAPAPPEPDEAPDVEPVQAERERPASPAPPPPAPPALARRRVTLPPSPPPPPATPAARQSEGDALIERPSRFQQRRAASERPKTSPTEGGWRARLLPHAWSAGAVLALLALCAQIVNHYRDDLAANTRFNRPLTALYAALGVALAPRWDLRAYDVRQLGASVDPGTTGLITVRASIKNAAPQAQPLPLLRVTLQDRFGNRIAARDVSPPSYLPHPAPASKFLSAGQRIDAEMGFVDPGANAVGFEIDACLPTAGGEVTCANDLSVR